MIIHATRSRLEIHCSVIEVLYFVRTYGNYIACQFAPGSLIQGLRGGFFGLILAAPVLVVIGWLGTYQEGRFLPALSLYPLQITGFGIPPIGIAWLTVHRTLAQMP